MADLFSQPESSPPARRVRPALQLTGPALIAPAPAAKPAKAEIAPRFGTPEWDRCTCQAYATLFFPNAGSIRRCIACAEAESRFSRTPFPRWSAKP